MWPFKKKIKPLNNSVLLAYRHEALGRLCFEGSWSGYWKTRIDGVDYRSPSMCGINFLKDEYGNFIRDALIDRVKMRRNPKKYSEELGMCRYGAFRYVCEDGTVEQWHW